jgi:hypothetical protein
MTWLMLKEDGSKQTLQLDKRQLITTAGLELPMRDMRLLDPAMQPFETVAQLLVRDNALVFSMEGARCIIMADKVMVPLEGEVSEQLERFLQVGAGAGHGWPGKLHAGCVLQQLRHMTGEQWNVLRSCRWGAGQRLWPGWPGCVWRHCHGACVRVHLLRGHTSHASPGKRPWLLHRCWSQ